MKKSIAFSFVLLSLSLTACGRDYVSMCKDTYTEINELPCMDRNTTINIDEMCPESYNESKNKYDDLFSCLKEHYKCDGRTLVNTSSKCFVGK